ncbi:hypothetical protein [Frigoribacterium faeni]|uniref:hypothetical protein n=1 Tax=Frigoribacterium faeni TaxID=145483 RepID=UPI001FAD0185|nr:hypothetical protein [Frigoribacterium faeni]
MYKRQISRLAAAESTTVALVSGRDLASLSAISETPDEEARAVSYTHLTLPTTDAKKKNERVIGA